jgi:tetratricopeptide (TPR) repeat protein
MLFTRFLLGALFFAVTCPVSAQQTTAASSTAAGLGKINFPTSCSSAAQPAFLKGVALLHSFQYAASEQSFEESAKADPHCAMAYWGMAMTTYHPLWEGAPEKALVRGHGYLEKIQKDWPMTPREHGYMDALGIIFSDTHKLGDDRVTSYSRAMGELHQHYPDDGEATAFYALSLLALPNKGDDTAVRKEAIAMLNKLAAEQPEHPGAVHYLIHAADTPELASQGLVAARSYAKIAPDSSHALHMPSHIFVRLGLWQESIDSNLAAASAAADATQQHLGEAHYQFHAMDFLDYSYLQMGEESKAQQVVDDLTKVPGASAHQTTNIKVNITTRNALELHHWKQALEMQPEGDSFDRQMIYAVRSIAASRTGDKKTAEENFKSLKKEMKNRQEPHYKYEDYRFNEVEAWLDYAKGKQDKALKLMHDAVTKQDKGDPGFNVPAREMLADMLMELRQPSDALKEYEAELKVEPNRFNALYGAETAAEMSGDAAKAKTYDSQLREGCGPQADRPELRHAKSAAAGSN